MQISELVSAIKKEGVDAAKLEADKIIAEARKKAEVIIEDANAEAEDMIKKAEAKVEVLKESAKTTAEHAKRDAMLFFKEYVKSEFEKILSADIQKTVDSKVLAKLILAAFADENPSNYTVEVAEVTECLKGELANSIKNGLEIKISPNVRTGFKLTAKDGSGYFDCSDEELEKILSPFFPELII